MSAAAVVKAVDVLKECLGGLISRCPTVPPNQFGFESFEEGLDGRVVVTVTLAAHSLPGKRLLQTLRGDTVKPNSRNRFW